MSRRKPMVLMLRTVVHGESYDVVRPATKEEIAAGVELWDDAPPPSGQAISAAAFPRELQWWLVKLPGETTLTPMWVAELTPRAALLSKTATGETVKRWYAREDIRFVDPC